MHAKAVLTVVAASLLCVPALAQAKTASIVKTAEPKTIDGATEDWGHISARHGIRKADGDPAATFRLAYDDKNIYALFEVIDDSPLKNSASMPEELIKGGDAVGFGLQALKHRPYSQRVMVAQIDGEPVLIAMRPEWDEKRPHTFKSPVGEVEMDYVGPVDGAKVATREVPGGYVVEMSLPWKSLSIPKRHTIGLDAQVIYSDPAGTTNVESAWWNTTGGDAYTVEDLPSEAKLYPDQWGEARLRSQDPGPVQSDAADFAPRPEGLPITFDLPRDAKVSLVVTDQEGFVLQELLRAENRKAGTHTVKWDGRDRYGEVLPPGDYRWKLIYFDGMGTKFLGSVGNSARPPYRTPDGKGSMGGQHGGASVVAAGPHGVYLMGGTQEGHPSMRAIDSDGRTLWKRGMGGWGSGRAAATRGDDLFMVQWTKDEKGRKLVRVDGATGKNIGFGDERDVPLGKWDSPSGFLGMAVVGDTVHIVSATTNTIERWNAETGERLDPIAVPDIGGIDRFDDNTLLVISGDQVDKLDLKSGRRRPFAQGLASPRDIAVDGQQRVYVIESGRQQIARFSPDGKLLGRIGKEGGRPATQNPYDPSTFRSLREVAVGPDDHLWIVERSRLRRTAKFTLDGKHLEDFFGPAAYNVVGPDLDDLSTVYYQTVPGYSTYAETKVDYDAYAAAPDSPGQAWRIQSVMTMTQDGEFAPKKSDDDDEEGNEDEAPDDLMIGAMKPGYGHVVAFKGDNGRRYFWRIAKHNRATMASGAAIWREVDGRWVPAAFVSNARKNGESWSDTNGDGKVQKDEIYGQPPTRNFAWLGRDLTLWGQTGTLKPTRIDERGVPYYDGGKFDSYLPEGTRRFEGWVFNSMPDKDGAVYFATNKGTHRHLSFWDRASENKVIKVADGKIKWVVGRHSPRMNKDGDLVTLSGVAGIVDDVVLVHNVEPAVYIAFTTDGLTLGNVIVDENGRLPRVGPNAIYIESFTGLFIKDPKTGKPVLFSVRSGDDPILEVTGPGQTGRLEGAITLDSSRARELLAADDRIRIPYETWWGTKGGGYGVNGYDWEWLPTQKGVPIRRGDALVGDIRLRRDAGSLHVLANAFDPPDDDPQITASDDLASLVGRAQGVELMLASPEANGPATRVFLTETGGKPVALQWRTDRQNWEAIEGADVAVRPRWQNYGWRLEAEIPLSSLHGSLTRVVPQSFRRPNKGDDRLKMQSEELPDLVAPLRFNAALHVGTNGAIERIAWIGGSRPGDSPSVMTPEQWGTANAIAEGE